LTAAILACAAPAWSASYDLEIARRQVNITGEPQSAITINGQIPGPVLRFREGETATVRVTNRMQQTTSVHWHGILLDAEQHAVPGFNGFKGIAPGETYTYQFPLRQNGTYWYHAHSATQEQSGHYGAIVVDPAGGPAISTDQDYVVVFSELAREDPDRILRNLKVDPGYYNYRKRTVGDFLRDARKFGLSAAVRDRADWGAMRMDPTDMADVGGYTLLVNGKAPQSNETFLFKPGQSVRLRFINASAMSFLDVRIPGLKLKVVSADGRDVEPVAVDEFRLSPAETYDVIVEPAADQAFTIFAESIDRAAYARATLAPRPGMSAAIPGVRPRAILTMAEMGHDMAGMDHAAMGHAARPAAASAKPAGLPRIDYGMGAAAMSAPEEGTFDGSGHVYGWASGAPDGSRVLSYADLRSATPQSDVRAPGREIVVRLGGNMERYIWTINGRKFEDADPIRLRYGERVRMTFINESMMAHPMHLHGMFVQLENGQPMERLPDKHVVTVAPGKSYSVLISADAPGEWAFHCHLLYHMASGMMQQVVVARLDGDAAPASAPAPSAPPASHEHHDHSGHGAGG
jgi:FtsP/CotA-like multicopper oxidase with cupredoxin domain